MPIHDDIANLKIWGSAPADAADFNDTIVDDLSDTGWPESYSPPGTDRPEREGFNTQFRRLTRLGVELRQSGAGLEWDARVVYHRSAVCRYLNILYVARQMNSNQTPSTSTANWRVLQDGRWTPEGTIPLNRMVNGTPNYALVYDSNGVLTEDERVSGGQGSPGENGWSPVLSLRVDGDRRVLRLDDWVGGQGNKPSGVGQYVGVNGLVTNIASAVDIRGARGLRGPQGAPPTGAGVIGWGETPTDIGEDDAAFGFISRQYHDRAVTPDLFAGTFN